jgi:hypothetical protein
MRFRADFDTLLHLPEVKLALGQKFEVFCCEKHSFGVFRMSESRGKIRKPWVRPLTVAHAGAVCLLFAAPPQDSVMNLHRVSAAFGLMAYGLAQRCLTRCAGRNTIHERATEINTVIKSPEQSTFRLIHGYG